MILTCVETSFSDLITTIRPNITWYSYNGDPVPVSGNPRVISGTGQLLFSELTSRNSGDYTCRASLSIPVAGINNLYNDTTFFVTDNGKEVYIKKIIIVVMRCCLLLKA